MQFPQPIFGGNPAWLLRKHTNSCGRIAAGVEVGLYVEAAVVEVDIWTSVPSKRRSKARRAPGLRAFPFRMTTRSWRRPA